jgi:hypothetical protein
LNNFAISDVLFNLGAKSVNELAVSLNADPVKLEAELVRDVMNGAVVFDQKTGKYDLSKQLREGYVARGRFVNEAEGKADNIQISQKVLEKKPEKIQLVEVEKADDILGNAIGRGALLNDPQTVKEQETKQRPIAKDKVKTVQANGKSKPVNSKAKRPGNNQVFKANKNQGYVGLFEKLVLKFSHSLSYFSFLIASLADLFLSVFFYYSLGYDGISKISLSLWGVVTIGSKLYAWSYRKYILGLWCAILSVFASVSIFLAVIQTQSEQVNQSNSVVTVSSQIDGRISSLEADRKALVTRRDSLPSDYTSAVQKLNIDIAKVDEQINKLMDSKLSPASIAQNEQVEIKLSAWKIFEQFTTIKWDKPAHVVAFLFIILLAGLLDFVIFVVTPRQVLLTKD